MRPHNRADDIMRGVNICHPIAEGLVGRSILEEEEAQAVVEQEELVTGMAAEGVAEMAANTIVDAEVSVSIEEETPAADSNDAISEEE